MQTEWFNLFKKIIEEEKYKQEILESDEFFLEKGRKLFQEFKNYPLEQVKGEEYLAHYQKSTEKSFLEYLKNFEPKSDEFLFFLLIGKVIAYFDLHAANKSQWNEYSDKRTLASISVRQDVWIKNLLEYKIKGNTKEHLPQNIYKSILFIEHPTEQLTILSDKFKELISQNFLHKNFESEKFVKNVFDFFVPFRLTVKNEENRGAYYSYLLFHPEIKKLWEKNNTEIEKTEAIQYWKIAPGENAFHWKSCLDNGYISIGWDVLGDLNLLFREQFDQNVDKMCKSDGWTKEACEQVWKFKNIPIGSLIVANKGTKEILGFGKVTSAALRKFADR